MPRGRRLRSKQEGTTTDPARLTQADTPPATRHSRDKVRCPVCGLRAYKTGHPTSSYPGLAGGPYYPAAFIRYFGGSLMGLTEDGKHRGYIEEVPVDMDPEQMQEHLLWVLSLLTEATALVKTELTGVSYDQQPAEELLLPPPPPLPPPAPPPPPGPVPDPAPLPGDLPPRKQGQVLVIKLKDVQDKIAGMKARNSRVAEKHLLGLESLGMDVSEVLDALEEYKVLERTDFDTAEEYAEARSDAWEEFLMTVEELEVEEEGEEEDDD